VLEHGAKDNVVEYVKKDGKTFIQINDYRKLRDLFGQLLGEIQRIKSEGDYAAGEALVEKYAVKVDQKLHQEVLDRYATLDIAPYKGFVNPVYVAVDAQGNPTTDENSISDIKVTYVEDYIPQMLRYSRDYSPLTK
jgi:dipeptidyl-peptidase-3